MENTRLQYLLDCFFANTCSPSEKDELMLLLDSTQNDEAVKIYIDNAWGKNIPPTQLTAIQSETILTAILSREKADVIPVSISAGFTKWYMAAAVLLVALSITAYYLFSGTSGQHNNLASGNPVPVQNDIPSGTTGAMLTLADGRVIVLDSVSEGNLASQGNTKILKTGGAVQFQTQSGTKAVFAGFNTIGTPRGRQFQLLLEDGTKVWLNAESSIRFPSVFGKEKRAVDITGEVYFEVAKNARRPFVVSVRGMQVQVLGTHFNVNAYNDETAIKTTLLEGSVKVVKNNKVQMLAPGQQAILGDKDELRVNNNINTHEIVAWKNDRFSFEDIAIRDLMRQVSRWYDVEIVMPRDIDDVRFTGDISKYTSLHHFLKLLELTGEVKFSIEDKKVIVKM